jgi:hypothetical protein
MKQLARWRLLLGLLCLTGMNVAAKESGPSRHYLYLFSFDDGEMSPDRTHTWGTFVEVSGADVRHVTLSWLPRSGKIKALVLGPERGVNHSLDSSFTLGVKGGWSLGQWGPYEITPEFFAAAEKQKARLEAGEFWYRVLDTSNRIFKVLAPETVPSPQALTCLHALSDIVLGSDVRGFLLTGRSAGFEGTAKAAWHFTGWYTRHPASVHHLNPVPSEVEAQMGEALSLGRYPQLRRFPLSPQPNQYCRTLEECRARASLFDFNL